MDTREKYRKYVNTACVKAVEPVVISQARGARILDEEGRSYTDLFAGISVVNAGHCNPEVVAAANPRNGLPIVKRVGAVLEGPDPSLILLGDNPDESLDSRDYGNVPIEAVSGKVLVFATWARS